MTSTQDLINELNSLNQLCADLSANMAPLFRNQALQSKLLELLFEIQSVLTKLSDEL